MTGKQKMAICFVALFLAGILLSTGVVLAKPIELSYNLIIPPRHLRNVNVWEPWRKMIHERTKGKVKITPYYAAALSPPTETFNTLVSGVADMGESIIYATPGKFPLLETVMLPELGLKTSLSCTRAMWNIYKKYPEVRKELAGVKVLWLHVCPAVKVMTTKKAVRSLKDLKGLKLRASGSTAVKTGKALGFTPVSVPVPEIYLSLEKGVVDGVVLPVELLVSRRLGEVVNYVTNTDLGHDAFFVAMNLNTWNSLPPDVQKVFEELSGDWAVDFTGKAWDRFDADAEKQMKAKGVEFIDLSPEENARWKKLIEPVKWEYAKELDAKGLPGTKVLKEFLNWAK